MLKQNSCIMATSIWGGDLHPAAQLLVSQSATTVNLVHSYISAHQTHMAQVQKTKTGTGGREKKSINTTIFNCGSAPVSKLRPWRCPNHKLGWWLSNLSLSTNILWGLSLSRDAFNLLQQIFHSLVHSLLTTYKSTHSLYAFPLTTKCVIFSLWFAHTLLLHTLSLLGFFTYLDVPP